MLWPRIRVPRINPSIPPPLPLTLPLHSPPAVYSFVLTSHKTKKRLVNAAFNRGRGGVVGGWSTASNVSPPSLVPLSSASQEPTVWENFPQ